MTTMATIQAKPLKINGFSMRKSCGRDLVERVERICQSRGGLLTYTKARRMKRGIVDECCSKKCADHHIYAYCSNNKPEWRSNESHLMSSSIETPVQLTDLGVSELQMPEAQALIRNLDSDNAIKSIDATSTVAPKLFISDHRYRNILVNGNIDSITLNRFLSTLQHNTNDFEVGTIPPEYQIPPIIPSRTRIIHV